MPIDAPDTTDEAVPLISTAVLRRAVDNVARWGDTDVFPFPIENHVFFDKNESTAALLGDISANFDTFLAANPVNNHSTLAPIGYTGFRWVTQIDPMWNAYLLALVLSVADSIESRRIPEAQGVVYSYRYRSSTDDSLFNVDGWGGFQQRSRSLAEHYPYVVTVDIADFYSRIYHHRLENELRFADAGGTVTKQTMKVLTRLSNTASYGLPVGGPAARILSELVLNRVDHLLLADEVTKNFCRFADDYRFFVPDLPSAYKTIGFLSEKLLRNEGLSLQKSKTRILTSAEYLSMLDPIDAPEGSAAKFLGLHVHFDPYSETADEDYAALVSQIGEFDIIGLLRDELNKGRIHTSLTRKLINALRFMPDEQSREQAVLSLLENIETLLPVVPQVMIAARSAIDAISDSTRIESIQLVVRNLIETSHHAAQIDLNLSYMVRVLAGRHTMENEILLIRLFDRPHGIGAGPSPAIQRDIMLTLAKWGVSYWLSDMKNYITSAHPWVRRAFIISSYQLGDEGNHWRRAASSTFSPFDEIIRKWAGEKAQDTGWSVPV